MGDLNKGNDGKDLVFEEVEVLPYDSVFNWALQDPVGFYRENERYYELKKAHGGDEIKAVIIEDMWKDRTKYHILRRFTWPPKFLGLGLFYTKGYYEDYEARPTVDVNLVTGKPIIEDQSKKTMAYKKLKQQVYLQVMQDDADRGKNRKREIIEEFPRVVELLQIGDDPNVPKAQVIEIQAAPIEALNPDGPQTETVLALLSNIPPNLGGHKHKRSHKKDDLTDWDDFDPADYDKTKLEVSHIADGTTQFALQNIFPNGHVHMGKHDHLKHGVLHAVITYKDVISAGIDYNNARSSDINGVRLVVNPKFIGGDDKSDEDNQPKKDEDQSKKTQPPPPESTGLFGSKTPGPPPGMEEIEVVSYEVVKKAKDPDKDKDKKKKKKDRKDSKIAIEEQTLDSGKRASRLSRK